MNNSVYGNNNKDINQQIFNINIDSKTPPEQIKELCKLGATINSKEDVQKIINNLFNVAGDIVNNEDSLFYISGKNIKILTDCVSKLELFKEYFSKYTDKQSQIFYNNLFSILFVLNLEKVISLYDETPIVFKNEKHILYIYGCALEFLDKHDDAITIFDDLYTKTKDITYFVQKLICLFDKKAYKEVYNLTKSLKKNEYDEYGFTSSLQMLSMVEIKKINSENDIKRLRSKFNDKPLFYSSASYLIHEHFNKNSPIINDYMKEGLILLKGCPLFIKVNFLEKTTQLEEEKQLLRFLKDNLENSIHLKVILLKMLQNESKKEKEDFKTMKDIVDELEKKEIDVIDINKAKAQISLDNHKELEAINYLSIAYDSNKEENTAFIILNLIIKNNDDNPNIQDYIDCLKKSTNPKYVISAAAGYNFLKNKIESSRMANKALYLLKNKIDEDIYIKYFGLMMLEANTEEDNFEVVKTDCAVYLKDKDNNIVVVIDNDLSSNTSLFSAKCYTTNSREAISLINKEKNDIFILEGKQYEIVNIIHKNSFFVRNISEKIRGSNIDKKYFREFVGDNAINEIKEMLIEDRKRSQEKFDRYDVEKNVDNKEINTLPLSFFCNNNDRTYKEIMEYLFYNKNSKFYAGEKNYYKLSKEKLVIDLTSLITLKEINQLTLLEKYKASLYFTKSLKNKLLAIFDSVTNEKIDGMKIFVDDDNNLRKTETTKESKKYNIDYWREIIAIVNNSNIIEYESDFDLDSFDKSQIDMLNMAIEEDMIYICDDLFIRKLANSISKNKIRMTNSSSLIDDFFYTDPNLYLEAMNQLTSFNFIYCIDCYSLYNILLSIVKINKIDDHMQLFETIIRNILKTKFLYELHIEAIRKFLIISFENLRLTKDVKILLQLMINIAIEYSQEYGYKFDIKVPDVF